MSTTVTLTDKTTTTSTVVNAKCAYFGIAVGATAATTYDVDNPDTVATVIGGVGPLVEGVAAAIRAAQTAQVAVPVAVSIPGTVGAVTTNGAGGATPTVAGTPPEAFTIRIKVTAAGTLGLGRYQWCLDGSTYQGEDYLPAEGSAAVTGTVDTTTFTWGASGTLDTLTLKADADVGPLTTCTFAAPTSLDDAVAQFNTAMGSSSSARARSIQGRFFQVYSQTTGTSSTLTIDATSTADTVLGISNTPVTGTAATWSPPSTGITFTFPAGTYNLGAIFTVVCTAPRFSTTDLLAAMDALFNDKTKTWDDIVVLQPFADGAETLAFASAVSTKLATWRSVTPRKAVVAFLGTSLGATGSTGITANDTDVKAACQNFTDSYITLCHGDGYASGTVWPGKLRRPLVHGVGILACSRRYSADLGSRDFAAIPEFDLVSPDGTVNARNELSATVKMYARQSAGQRFTVAKLEDGEAYIVKGVTRAVVTSKFRHVGVMRLGRAALNLANSVATTFENTDPLLSAKGTLRETYAAGREAAVDKVFRAAFVDVGPDQDGHASDVRITLDRTEKVSQTDNITLNGEILPRGQAENVTFAVGIVGELTAA